MEGSREKFILICGPMVLAVLSTCAMARFAHREASCLSLLTSAMGVTLALSIVAVMPYDVWEALASQGHTESHAEGDGTLLLRHSWAAIYWGTACLCYLLVPVLMEYEAAGEFTASARLRTSLRRNAAFYVAYLAIGSLLLVWLFIRGSVQGSLQSYCIAASNAWGLLLLTLLMGFGLVAVPRHFRRLACPKEQLKNLYPLAAAKDEARLSSLFELQDTVGRARAELTAEDRRCGEDVEQRVDAEDPEISPGIRRANELAFAALQHTLHACDQLHWELTCATRPGGGEIAAPGGAAHSGGLAQAYTERMRRFAQLHRELKDAGLDAKRAVCRWENHVQRCIFFEDLEERQFKAAAELLGAPRQRCDSRSCCPRLERAARLCWCRLLALWLRSLRARVLLALSYACGLLSAVIVLGQLTMFHERWSLSLLSFLFRDSRAGSAFTQFLCVVPLSYMTYTAYFSIFRLKVSGWYGIYGNHNTDAGSLLWCASLLVRLAPPLCYHFLLLIRVQGTTFQAFMGQMNVVPVLGDSFNEIFPCLIAVLCCCNFLNLYSRLVQCLSLGVIEFELSAGAEGADPLVEGRQLIERERRRRAEECSSMELPSRSSTPDRLAMPLAAPA
eukprot:CAMPEP_0180735102 /NCGR_PEP_ID=MMETSP1038_2-20121128/23053_1 /TAXON_ID=632150 /ORGANISM="Azadinium spinosum, Strain 3D9" /LENGTH=616 /DNA_ID=CAMNT_0022768065 /DNA_START=35 /DNA_END=1882 /DNA_ORIENTATION=-